MSRECEVDFDGFPSKCKCSLCIKRRLREIGEVQDEREDI